jgi:hypothetical protein
VKLTGYSLQAIIAPSGFIYEPYDQVAFDAINKAKEGRTF